MSGHLQCPLKQEGELQVSSEMPTFVFCILAGTTGEIQTLLSIKHSRSNSRQRQQVCEQLGRFKTDLLTTHITR